MVRKRGIAKPDEPMGERIRAAVMRAIAEQGYARVNFQEVADSLGVSKASIYYHVGSKEELLYGAIVERYTRHVERLDEILHYPFSPRDRLRLYLRERTHNTSELKQLAAKMGPEARYLSPQHREVFVSLRDEIQKRLVTLLDEGVAAGQFRATASTKLVAVAIFGMLNNFHDWYREGGPFTRDQIADLWWEMVCRGLDADEADAPVQSS